MRIACVHIPQFALQTLTRIDPSLRGAAVAVVGSGASRSLSSPVVPGTAASVVDRARAALFSPIVLACSRGAWALGVRLGMTAAAANNLAPGELRVVTADPAAERETVRALADALLGASATVDVGGRVGAGGAHLAMYCEVPTKTRGTSFGDRLVELCAALGVTARIGIADDRFTAWVAASSSPPPTSSVSAAAPLHHDDSAVISVPRGGSAAFLAPRPLSLLSITPEVLHMLESLGVRTLGEFASLPAPSVARPVEADYQALARGDSGHDLRPYAPEAPIREDVAITSGAGLAAPAVGEHATSTGAAIALLAQRLAVRLAGRGRGAAQLEVTVSGASGERVVQALQTAGTRTLIDSADDLADAITLVLDGDAASPWRLRATVTAEAVTAGASLSSAANENVETAAERAGNVVDVLGLVLSTTGSAAARADLVGHARTLRDERRDSHHRTRRTRETDRPATERAPRRRVDPAAAVQGRLFADLK
ncbi:MAG TPA: hypothetical protein VGM90_20980 [Kofleriaceae bacterium]|jgi:hypothetical protein